MPSNGSIAPVSGLNRLSFSDLARLRAVPSSRDTMAAACCSSLSRVSLYQISRFSVYSLSGYARGLQPGGTSLVYCFSLAGVDGVDGNIVNCSNSSNVEVVCLCCALLVVLLDGVCKKSIGNFCPSVLTPISSEVPRNQPSYKNLWYDGRRSE